MANNLDVFVKAAHDGPSLQLAEEEKKIFKFSVSPRPFFKGNIEMKPFIYFFLDILPTFLPAAVATDV